MLNLNWQQVKLTFAQLDCPLLPVNVDHFCNFVAENADTGHMPDGIISPFTWTPHTCKCLITFVPK